MIGNLAISSLPTVGGGSDVLSSKVGDWAFNATVPATYNEKQDVPGGFSAQPVDSVVMDYLDGFITTTKLPVAHLYGTALQDLAAKIDDEHIKALLQEDCHLHAYLRARRIGDVYE